MTDRFALSYAAQLSDGPDQGQLSVEAVKAAADFVDVVSARTQLRKAGGRYTGRCPFHEERTPSFSVNAVDKLYYCFGCGAKGDLITFVRETRGARLRRLDRVARASASASRSSTRRARPRRTPRATRRERLFALLDAGSVVLRADALGDGGRVVRARLPEGPRTRRGGVPRVPARVRARRRLARAQGAREGVHDRRAACRRADPAARRRLLQPAAAVPAHRRARPRARLPGATSCFDDDPLPAKYVNTPESELFHKGSVVYGLDKARAAIAKRGPRLRRRGEHRRDRAPPGRLRAGRRVHGHGAHRAAAEGARPAHASGSGWRSTAMRPARPRRCAGWRSPCSRASTSRSSPLAAGVDPADDPDGFDARLAAAEPYVLYRTTVEIDRAEDRETAFCARSRRCSTRFRTRRSGRTPGGTRTTGSA